MRKLKLTYTRTIALSFLIIILAGAVLLCFPFSSRNGQWTAFSDCLFTATSSTCVTGLIVVDTYTHWSVIGQLIIITMIQIGGLGVMTVIAMLALFLKKQISLKERKLLMISSGSMELSGIVRLIKKILIGTFTIEGIGAAVLCIKFIPKMGLLRGIYNAVFHSISAFCNAGFDIMGKYEKFSSLTSFDDDIIVNITIMSLIVIGGIGFIVWNDIIKWKSKFKKYTLHSQIVLITTAILVVFGTLLFYIFERSNALANYSESRKWLASAFLSITPRTAGMNTIDMTALSPSSMILTKVFMFIGGSPGSTAGGVKTTTIVVLIICAFAASRRNSSVIIGKRKLEDGCIRQASAIITIYMIAILFSTIIICAIEPYSAQQVSFEVVSAIGTVGLTLGITPTLSIISQGILTLLMFGGRVGGLSLMLVLAEKRKNVPIDRPVEKILIG